MWGKSHVVFPDFFLLTERLSTCSLHLMGMFGLFAWGGRVGNKERRGMEVLAKLWFCGCNSHFLHTYRATANSTVFLDCCNDCKVVLYCSWSTEWLRGFLAFWAPLFLFLWNKPLVYIIWIIFGAWEMKLV